MLCFNHRRCLLLLNRFRKWSLLAVKCGRMWTHMHTWRCAWQRNGKIMSRKINSDGTKIWIWLISISFFFFKSIYLLMTIDFGLILSRWKIEIEPIFFRKIEFLSFFIDFQLSPRIKKKINFFSMFFRWWNISQDIAKCSLFADKKKLSRKMKNRFFIRNKMTTFKYVVKNIHSPNNRKERNPFSSLRRWLEPFIFIFFWQLQKQNQRENNEPSKSTYSRARRRAQTHL